jgi:hypothetical protein
VHRLKASGAERRGDGLAIDSSLRNHDKATLTRFVRPPRAVEIATEALSNALHKHPHRLSRYLNKAFDA